MLLGLDSLGRLARRGGLPFDPNGRFIAIRDFVMAGEPVRRGTDVTGDARSLRRLHTARYVVCLPPGYVLPGDAAPAEEPVAAVQVVPAVQAAVTAEPVPTPAQDAPEGQPLPAPEPEGAGDASPAMGAPEGPPASPEEAALPEPAPAVPAEPSSPSPEPRRRGNQGRKKNDQPDLPDGGEPAAF